MALLLAVWLMPTPGAAQTNSLPSTAFGRSDFFRAGSSTYAPAYDRLPIFTRQSVPGWYAIGSRADANDPSPVTSEYMARGMGVPQRRDYEPSRLRVDVVPSTARVYVDGSYIGTVSDVNYRSGGYRMSPGSHRVTVRAPGYQGSGASVWVPPGQSVLYQDYLDRSLSRVTYRPTFVPVSHYRHPSRYAGSPFRSIARQGPPPTYVIPGCFAGDAPPRPEKLLPGCKVEDLKKIYH
jgi:hypothetical protein